MPLESHQCGRGCLVRGVGENNDNEDDENNGNNDNDNDNNGNNSNDQHDVAINTTTSIV